MAAAAARFDDTSNTAGPFIKFGNLVGDSWTGSILFMTRNDTTPPSAKLYVRSNPSSSVRRRLEPKLLDTCHGWRFWRFEVAVTLCPEETAVDYEVTATGLVKKATFWVQASGKPFHVGYTSCNGISLSIPAGHYARQDPTYCWRDIVQVHARIPIHVLIGGGDQVYSDAVWKKEAFVAWGDLHKYDKPVAPWTQEHQEQATAFYLNNYIDSFTMPVVSDVYACLPSYFVWDDHDVFDGFGSYSKGLQGSEFFSRLFAVARRFYLLFQLHTTEEIATANEQLEWIDKDKSDGYHSVKYVLSGVRIACPDTESSLSPVGWSVARRSLGHQIAAIGIDMRSKRTKHRIIPESTYRIIEEQMLGLPDHVEHVVVLSGVPVVFPTIWMSESILFGMLALVKRSAVLRRFGRRIGLLDRFDQPVRSLSFASTLSRSSHLGWVPTNL